MNETKTYTAYGAKWLGACRFFQCEGLGEYSSVDPAMLCCGEDFHATVMPLHIVRFFATVPGFWAVEVTEACDPQGEGGAAAVERTVKIGDQVDLTELAAAQIAFARDTAEPAVQPGGAGTQDRPHVPEWETACIAMASGASMAAWATGLRGMASPGGMWAPGREGKDGAIVSPGCGFARAAGDSGTATAFGRSGVALVSDGRSVAWDAEIRGVALAEDAALVSGQGGVALVTGDSSAVTAAGRDGVAITAGQESIATASGERGIAIASGRGGRARGALGTWIVLTERDDAGGVVCVRSALVDGEQIKADTPYALREGQFVAAAHDGE